MSIQCPHVGHSGQQPPSDQSAETANPFQRWWTRFWSDFTFAQKAAFWALLVLAAISSYMGFKYQGESYWADKPFVINMFSSFTAALFGIPLAIILLNKLNLHQGRAMRRRTVREIATRTLENLEQDMDGLWPGTRAALCDFKSKLDSLDESLTHVDPSDASRSQALRSKYKSLAERWNAYSVNSNKLKAAARGLESSVGYLESRVHSDFRELEWGWIDADLDRMNWKYMEQMRPAIRGISEKLDTNNELITDAQRQDFIAFHIYVANVHNYHSVFEHLNTQIQRLLSKQPQSPQLTPSSQAIVPPAPHQAL